MTTSIARLGIWTAQFDFHPSQAVAEAQAEIEELGYSTIWFGENVGREPFTQAAQALQATQRLIIATGVSNIWARDAAATKAAQLTLSEAHPARFMLGVGVGHPILNERRRGSTYQDPIGSIAAYLDDMAAFANDRYRAAAPEREPPTLLGALGPKMTELAATKADGAITYFVPPEHTEQTRQTLGPNKFLAVTQAVVLNANRVKARAIAKTHTRRYVTLPNYTNNLRRLGFTDADFHEEGSARLVDAIVAAGDLQAIATRVQQHLDAGADHVCLNVVPEDFEALPTEEWRQLSALL